MGKGQSKSHIVIFVEGDTDQIFLAQRKFLVGKF